jgi:hypothetical protein
MSEPAEQFALVPLPPPGEARDGMTANAIMVGDMSAVAEPILSSVAREQTEALLAAAEDAIAEEHRLARQRERDEAAAYSDAVQKLCEGAAKMASRLDALEQTRRAAAREARRKQRADELASLPDPDEPDDPHTANAPGFGPEHEPRSGPSGYSEDDIDTPTGRPPLSYGNVPTSYVRARSEGAIGNLPEAPPELGDFPTYDPAELAQPQPEPPTPSAIGGP